MPGKRLIGDAYIAVIPDTSPFDALKAGLDAKAAAVHPQVKVGAELDKGVLQKILAQIKALRSDIQVGLGLKPADVAKVKSKLKALGDTAVVGVRLSPSELAAAKATLESYLRGSDAEIHLTADIIEKYGTPRRPSHLPPVPVDVVAEFKKATLAKIKAEMDAASKADPVEISTEISPASMAISKFAFDNFVKTLKAKPNIDFTAPLRGMASLENQARYLSGILKNMTVGEGPGITRGAADLINRLRQIQTQADTLRKALANMQLQGIDTTKYDQSLANVDSVTSATLRSVIGNWQNFGDAVGKTKAKVDIAAAATTAAMNVFIQGAGTGWGILQNKIVLFAGVLDKVLPQALTRVSVWHLAADWIAEFAAVLAPAAIDVGLWGAAVTPIFADVGNRLKDMQSAAAATGTSIGIFNYNAKGAIGPIQSLQNKLQPGVWEIFGDAVRVATSKTGAFSTIVQGVQQVVLNLAARMTEAFKSSTFSTILQNGVTDFQRFGTIIGNLGGAFGSFVKDVPGYAAVIEELFVKLSYGIENFVNFAGPVIKAGLALHGFFLYTGLAVTALPALLTAVANGAKNFFTFADGVAGGIGALGNWVKALLIGDGAAAAAEVENSKLLSSFAGAGAKAKDFGKQMLALGTNPYVLGIAAIGAAVFGMITKWNAAQAAVNNFVTNTENKINSMQGGQALIAIPAALSNFQLKMAQVNSSANFNSIVKGFSSWNNVIGNTGSELATVGHRFVGLFTQAKSFTAGLKNAGKLILDIFSPASLQSDTAHQIQINGLNELQAAYRKLSGEQQNLFKTTALVMQGQTGATKTTFSFSDSLGILSAAGVQAGDSFQTMMTKVQGLLTGWNALNLSGGQLANAYKAIDLQTEMNQSHISELTGAYSSFISMITGGQSSFTTFGTGLSTLNQALSGAGASGVKFNDSLGKFTVSGTAAGASLKGMSNASLNAQGAFQSQIVNAQNLYNSLLPLSTVSNLGAKGQGMLAQAMKDMVGSMLPLAKGNPVLISELSGLAQIAGGKATTSFQDLSKWVGNTKNPMQDLKSITDKFTVSAGNLAQDAQNLAGALGQTLTGAISTALFAASGGPKAMNALAQSIYNLVNGKGSTNALVQSLKNAIPSLKLATGSTDNAKQEFLAMAAAAGVKGPQALAIWNSALGQATAAAKANTFQNKVLNQASANLESSFKNAAAATKLSDKSIHELWGDIKNQNLDMLAGKAVSTKNAFIQWAVNGLGVSTQAAEKMWKTNQAQNLDKLAMKASTTKDAFVKMAMNGLNISKSAAEDLWKTLRMQYLDTLVAKGNSAKNSFIQLAMQGLGLTKSKATDLWNTMKQQYLDTAAAKAGMTKQAFEKLASQFGVTKSDADKLWASMQKPIDTQNLDKYNAALKNLQSYLQNITAKTWNVNVQMNIQQAVAASGTTSPGSAAAAVTAIATGRRKARGGILRGEGPAGKDGPIYQGAPGELVIPSSHAAMFGDMARRAGIPGFAAGGFPGAGSVYSFGSGPAGTYTGSSGTGAPQMPPMTQMQGAALLDAVQQMVMLLRQQPQAIGRAVSNPAGTGVQAAYYGTIG